MMHGTWADSELIMDDDKALSHAFLADGTRYTGSNRNYTAGTEDVHFVLKEGGYSDFNSACLAKRPELAARNWFIISPRTPAT